MELLAFSIAILLLAPLAYGVIKKYSKVLFWLDRTVFLIVAGLVLIELLPHSIEEVGYWALVLAFVGWIVPYIFERYWESLAEHFHLVPLILAMVGIVMHGFMDGVGLYDVEAMLHHGRLDVLPFAVVLHRIPVSIFIWWLLYPTYGWKLPTFVLTMIGLSTIAGYVSVDYFVLVTEAHTFVAACQAVVAGSLLHLAFHRH